MFWNPLFTAAKLITTVRPLQTSKTHRITLFSNGSIIGRTHYVPTLLIPW